MGKKEKTIFKKKQTDNYNQTYAITVEDPIL
jgi:hypothetical protein